MQAFFVPSGEQCDGPLVDVLLVDGPLVDVPTGQRVMPAHRLLEVTWGQ